jgi:hypothetical protein
MVAVLRSLQEPGGKAYGTLLKVVVMAQPARKRQQYMQDIF